MVWKKVVRQRHEFFKRSSFKIGLDGTLPAKWAQLLTIACPLLLRLLSQNTSEEANSGSIYAVVVGTPYRVNEKASTVYNQAALPRDANQHFICVHAASG